MSFTIKQAADRIGVTVPTLRYYDKEGLLPFLKKKDNGTRVFKEEDFQSLAVINCLKCSGLSIKDIRMYIDLCEIGDETLEQRRKLFIERQNSVLEQMKKLEDILSTIKYKIEYYDSVIEAGTEAAFHMNKE